VERGIRSKAEDEEDREGVEMNKMKQQEELQEGNGKDKRKEGRKKAIERKL
jgi:hypothetical protein